MSGYSPTPLAGKLGIKAGQRVFLENAPDDYADLIGPLVDAIQRTESFDASVELAHIFHRVRVELDEALRALRTSMAPAAVIWVSWPKKASRVPTDITEDCIREIALPLGLVDIKVCAVDAVWSGLKLMLRRELR